MEKSKIILDCDPGHDDAVAIMIAAVHPGIDLLGITTVAGKKQRFHRLDSARECACTNPGDGKKDTPPIRLPARPGEGRNGPGNQTGGSALRGVKSDINLLY